MLGGELCDLPPAMRSRTGSSEASLISGRIGGCHAQRRYPSGLVDQRMKGGRIGSWVAAGAIDGRSIRVGWSATTHPPTTGAPGSVSRWALSSAWVSRSVARPTSSTGCAAALGDSWRQSPAGTLAGALPLAAWLGVGSGRVVAGCVGGQSWRRNFRLPSGSGRECRSSMVVVWVFIGSPCEGRSDGVSPARMRLMPGLSRSRVFRSATGPVGERPVDDGCR